MRANKLLPAMILFACGATSGAAADSLGDYRKAMEKVGLSPVLPADEAFAPGYIYELVEDQNKRVFPRKVCDNAFLTKMDHRSAALPEITDVKDRGLSFGLKFLPKLVGDKIKASLGFDVSSIKTTSLSFDDMTIWEVAQKNTLDSDQQTVSRRQVNPACEQTLVDITKNGKFTGRVFMVVRAVTAKSIDYDMSLTSGGATGAGKVDAKPAETNPVDAKTGDAAKGDAPKTDAAKTATSDTKSEVKTDTNAVAKPAPNTGALAITVADTIELSAGWKYAKTGMQSFKVEALPPKSDGKAPERPNGMIFAADIVRLKSAKSVTAISNGVEAERDFATAKPKASDLEALAQ